MVPAVELLGHFVNVRKQVSPSMDEDSLLPEEGFRLYAVCARFPQLLRDQLAELDVPLVSLSHGVYEVRALGVRIRIIVANQLPETENNAMLLLFSSKPDLVSYGIRHYRIHSAESSTLLPRLLRRHQEEGQIMPEMLAELARQTIDQLLKELPVEKRLEGLTPKQRVQGLTAEQLRELLNDLDRNGGSAKQK